MKRLLDLVLALFLLVGLFPLLLVIAVAVKISSPGPVFFCQSRVGRFGLPFRIVKLRTMAVRNDGALLTVAGDHRVTRIGRFLRQWKLDELPQLWNIVRGEMSFVGPRPEVPDFVALYRPQDMQVFGVRPGLTDLATLKYRHEEVLLAAQAEPLRYYREVILPDKIRLSRQYMQKHSLVLDFKILGATLRQTLRSERQGQMKLQLGG